MGWARRLRVSSILTKLLLCTSRWMQFRWKRRWKKTRAPPREYFKIVSIRWLNSANRQSGGSTLQNRLRNCPYKCHPLSLCYYALHLLAWLISRSIIYGGEVSPLYRIITKSFCRIWVRIMSLMSRSITWLGSFCSMQVDAAIVRIMKTRKTLSHTLLITELFQQVTDGVIDMGAFILFLANQFWFDTLSCCLSPSFSSSSQLSRRIWRRE